ncbi:MAG TPA: helicase HerA-like domain-containing protein [Propionibacteriaceae bacterium]|jgi:MoxR-like ATPase
MTDDDTVATITKGYTFSEETIELGVLMADGNLVPDAKIRIPLGMLNRHGLIAGATGTGKTKTLQLLARTAAIVRPGSRLARRGS